MNIFKFSFQFFRIILFLIIILIFTYNKIMFYLFDTTSGDDIFKSRKKTIEKWFHAENIYIIEELSFKRGEIYFINITYPSSYQNNNIIKNYIVEDGFHEAKYSLYCKGAKEIIYFTSPDKNSVQLKWRYYFNKDSDCY